MPANPSEFDDLVREALGPADAELLDGASSDSMTALLTDAFRGRNRRLAIGGAVVNLAFFVLAIVSGLRFLRADDQRTMLLWGAATLLCFGIVTAIKIWYWIEMNRLAVTREVKRVELRVAQLAHTIAGTQHRDDPA